LRKPGRAPTMREMPRLSTLALALAAGACAGPPAAPEPMVAVATISPLADVVARVAGPSWTVRTLIPPGVSPHVFEPSPKDVRLVAPARLIVTVGAGYDVWAAKLAASCASTARIFDAGAAGSSPRRGRACPRRGPRPAPVAVAARSGDPPGAGLEVGLDLPVAGYRGRATASRESCHLDEEVARSGFRGPSIVTAHNAWTHAERYAEAGRLHRAGAGARFRHGISGASSTRQARISGRSSRSPALRRPAVAAGGPVRRSTRIGGVPGARYEEPCTTRASVAD
jgi:hypothetical protein